MTTKYEFSDSTWWNQKNWAKSTSPLFRIMGNLRKILTSLKNYALLPQTKHLESIQELGIG